MVDVKFDKIIILLADMSSLNRVGTIYRRCRSDKQAIRKVINSSSLSVILCFGLLPA